MEKSELIEFEKEVKQLFLDGKLRSPVHLSGGNESELIEIFKEIKPHDWVFTTYRSHYHALLKGVPKEELKEWVLDNKSIHFMSSKHKVFSSAIVGGTLPIALGVAMAVKRNEKILDHAAQTSDNIKSIEWLDKPHVYCFIGDMTASLGTFFDCFRYASYNDLPITFIIEDNGLSTDTPSGEAWGSDAYLQLQKAFNNKFLKYYRYKRVYPHYGVGEFVKF